ncbi:MAG: asparagine synthase (glutamine-hydrolyzing) [Ruminococcus sp.]|nr:asparagine synthase (glutamine-hydrolyzing) [Ruminococcus sp.]
MCGIAGVISFKEDMHEEVEKCKRMQTALLRRGPDQNGIFISQEAVFAHTRLTVIDAVGGRQPMTITVKGREYTIIYNGELYNTDELRNELGCDFVSRSDTEVVLRSYIQLGEKCVDSLNGIFAFVIYDAFEHRVFLARDRIGVKPLFFYEMKNKLIFASELPALLENPDIPHEINEYGVAELLLMAPGRTPGFGVIRGVSELKCGECGYYTVSGLKLHEYWRLRAYDLNETFEQTVEHTRELIIDSIRGQLVSDVPVCTFLSGGLDSSLISSVVAKDLKRQGRKLNTFSVDYLDNDKYFKESRFQPNSDSEYIKIMANYLDSEHHWVIIDTSELVGALEAATDARGLPGMADVDASMLLLCREIKKTGTVALSGECADELFGGYPWYRDKRIREIEGFPWAQSTAYRKRFMCERYLKLIDADEYVSSAYRNTVINADKLNSDSPLEGRMREMTELNFRWFMQNLLDRKDRMSMYSGLEVRVPFCDYKIAEYMYNVKWKYKDYKGREKGLLREAMNGVIPDEVLWRKKSPYPKTHNPLFLKNVTLRLKDILKNNTPITELVCREEVEKLVNHEENVQWYGQLMNLPQTIAYFIQLDYWMRRYRIKLV